MTYQETKTKYQDYDLRSLVLFSNSATFKGDKKAIRDLVAEKKATKESEGGKANSGSKAQPAKKEQPTKKAQPTKKEQPGNKKGSDDAGKKTPPVKKGAGKKEEPIKKTPVKKTQKLIAKERAPKGTTDDPRGSTITVKKMSDLPKNSDTKGFTIGDKVFDANRNESGTIISFTYYSKKPQYTYPRIETPTGKFLVGLKRLTKVK